MGWFCITEVRMAKLKFEPIKPFLKIKPTLDERWWYVFVVIGNKLTPQIKTNSKQNSIVEAKKLAMRKGIKTIELYNKDDVRQGVYKFKK